MSNSEKMNLDDKHDREVEIHEKEIQLRYVSAQRIHKSHRVVDFCGDFNRKQRVILIFFFFFSKFLSLVCSPS